jgi:hypothetical protein
MNTTEQLVPRKDWNMTLIIWWSYKWRLSIFLIFSYLIFYLAEEKFSLAMLIIPYLAYSWSSMQEVLEKKFSCSREFASKFTINYQHRALGYPISLACLCGTLYFVANYIKGASLNESLLTSIVCYSFILIYFPASAYAMQKTLSEFHIALQNYERQKFRVGYDAFTLIASRFPTLQIIKNKSDFSAGSITFPQQTGMKYETHLCQQKDGGLRFTVENFQLRAFPSSDPAKVRDFTDDVSGFLSGKYRIIEHYRGKVCIKSELQTPTADNWETIHTLSKIFGFVLPWKKSVKEIRNS